MDIVEMLRAELGEDAILEGEEVATENEIALSLERFIEIEEVDAAGRTMTVQSGVTLEAVQQRADQEGLMFPIDLGARGSCSIGGNVSTNAGGNRVIRYGMPRAQVLGLEVVLADGTVIDDLRKMLKNNAGYDLKQSDPKPPRERSTPLSLPRRTNGLSLCEIRSVPEPLFHSEPESRAFGGTQ